MSIFDEMNEIMFLNEKLGNMLSNTRTIEVRGISKSEPVKVTRYIKAYGPWNDEIYLTESQLKSAKSLGLSVREAEACYE